MRSIKGYTYNLSDGTIQRTKLNKEQIVTKTINDYSDQVTIRMPGVKAGSIIEVLYAFYSNMVTDIPDCDLQHDIPVLHSEIIMGFLDSYKYNTQFKGSLTPVADKKTSESGSITYSAINGSYARNIMSGIYTLDKRHLVYENIPSLEKEPFVNSMENYCVGHQI